MIWARFIDLGLLCGALGFFVLGFLVLGVFLVFFVFFGLKIRLVWGLRTVSLEGWGGLPP